jgi:prepilin-type processing-associated H-X9-DG protein
MTIYVTQNGGWLPGSYLTTGRPAARPAPNANCPMVAHINDWQAPLGKIMGMKFDEGPLLATRVARFVNLMNRPAFICPENDLIAIPLDTPVFPATQANSYVTAVQFLYEHKVASIPDTDVSVGENTTYSFHNPPPGYAPKIGKVGNAAEKIFIACGGKYSDSSSADARMPLSLRYDWGGAFGDRGPWYIANKAWDRIKAPGNGGTTGFDPRIYAYRHGDRRPGGPADTFKFTAAFFDGHVEVLGDLTGADPALWNPKGTRLQVAANRVYADVKQRYFNNVDGVYTLK